jgi:hypothetical protein
MLLALQRQGVPVLRPDAPPPEEEEAPQRMA